MELKCGYCRHKWEYKGKSAFNVTCPRCKIKGRHFIKENLKYAEKGICKYCGKQFYKKRPEQIYCDPDCQKKVISKLGAKAMHEKYDLHGSNNPHWKGGISKNNFHYKKIQIERYPAKVRCRVLLHRLVRSGKIIPPKECSKCGKECKPHAHHKDYSKPTDVEWLCKPCHRAKHGGKH